MANNRSSEDEAGRKCKSPTSLAETARHGRPGAGSMGQSSRSENYRNQLVDAGSSPRREQSHSRESRAAERRGVASPCRKRDPGSLGPRIDALAQMHDTLMTRFGEYHPVKTQCSRFAGASRNGRVVAPGRYISGSYELTRQVLVKPGQLCPPRSGDRGQAWTGGLLVFHREFPHGPIAECVTYISGTCVRRLFS